MGAKENCMDPQLNTAEDLASTPATKSKPVFPICEHIKDNGLRCGSPAIRGRHFCYFHSRAHQPPVRIGDSAYRSPIVESTEALQIAVSHVLQALAMGDLPPKMANSMFYGLHLATKVLRMSKPLPETQIPNLVSEIPPAMQELDRQDPGLPPLEELCSALLTDEQLEQVRNLARRGESDPGYADAVRRMYANAEAIVHLNRRLPRETRRRLGL